MSYGASSGACSAPRAASSGATSTSRPSSIKADTLEIDVTTEHLAFLGITSKPSSVKPLSPEEFLAYKEEETQRLERYEQKFAEKKVKTKELFHRATAKVRKLLSRK